MIARLHRQHLKYFNPHDEQIAMNDLLKDETYVNQMLETDAYAIIVDGVVICIAGVMPKTQYIGLAWAVLSKDIGRNMVMCTRAISDFLLKSNYDRIETPVRRDFVNGHRWVKLMGFVNETPETGMKYYGYHGETYDLYALYTKELNNGQTQPL